MDTTMDVRMFDAMVELRDHEHAGRGPFWWRQASMKRLFAMGLVEPWHPEGKELKRMASRLTPKGKLQSRAMFSPELSPERGKVEA